MFARHSTASLAKEIAEKSTTSPEFWLFNSPASPRDIKRLERKIGRSIPEPLAALLSHVNGGFIPSQGKVCIDSPMEVASARMDANRFLSCEEIAMAYEALLETHPEADPSKFPFIPIARGSLGAYLVVNAEDPMCPVFHAWTLEGPHMWRRLYPCLPDLLSHYLNSGGKIIESPYDDEPTAIAAAY